MLTDSLKMQWTKYIIVINWAEEHSSGKPEELTRANPKKNPQTNTFFYNDLNTPLR